jgi:hypothetical protein
MRARWGGATVLPIEKFDRVGIVAASAIALVVSMGSDVRADVPYTDREPAPAHGRIVAFGPETAEVETREPVLIFQQTVDINGDGKDDVVSYYSSRPDQTLDAESIDFGSTGRLSVLAVRLDFDGDGKDDDWIVVDPATEDVKAALVDTDDDGEVDTVDLGGGRREPYHGRTPRLPAAGSR